MPPHRTPSYPTVAAALAARANPYPSLAAFPRHHDELLEDGPFLMPLRFVCRRLSPAPYHSSEFEDMEKGELCHWIAVSPNL